MDTAVYERLRKRFDAFPTSFPKTEEGIEIDLLKKCFTEQEAEIASLLPLHSKEAPEDIQTIAKRIDRDAGVVGDILESMAKKGLIYATGDEGCWKFSLLPFILGMIEFNAYRVNAEFIELFDRHASGPMRKVIQEAKVRHTRIIPVEQRVSPESKIQHYDDVIKAIETSSSLNVMPCFCRTRTRALGKGCDHPVETCLFLNDYADYLNRTGQGRRLSKEEAINLIRECEKAGLIHTSNNIRETDVICNCCSCCCFSLTAQIKLAEMGRLDLGPNVSYRVAIDPDRCTLCETCIEQCLTNALKVEKEQVLLDSHRCIGCGACVSVCPSDALCLERKPKEEICDIPQDYSDLYSRMGWRE